MHTFVDDLRLSAEDPNRRPQPPCFRQVLYGFLAKDYRRCPAYMDGSLLCGSCNADLSRTNPTIKEFTPIRIGTVQAPPHPSIRAQQNTSRRQEADLELRVRLISFDHCVQDLWKSGSTAE